MTDQRTLVAYRSSGGRPPSDDERLDVWPDGRFEARRTVAGARVGRFAGQLEAAALSELQARAGAAAAAGDIAIPTPMDGATVSILTAGREARFGSNEQLEGPWAPLAALLKTFLDGDALADPVASLELEASAPAARVRHLGSEPLEVDAGSVAVRVVRLDAQGAVLGRWQGSLAPQQAEDSGPAPQAWTTAEPGWQIELPFRHGLELTRDDWLQVWVTLRLRDAGERRAVRLFVAVQGAG